MLLNIRKLESSRWRWQAKKKGIENGTYIRYVIENTYRKNVCFSSFHDVDENKRVKRVLPRSSANERSYRFRGAGPGDEEIRSKVRNPTSKVADWGGPGVEFRGSASKIPSVEFRKPNAES
jgi:hypothetical protein